MRPRPISCCLVILLAAGAGFSSPVSATTPFVAESVTPHFGSGPSLALDTQDDPHISYRDEDTGYLMYATKADLIFDPASVTLMGDWKLVILDATSSFLFTSLALDSAGRPHISYYDDVTQDLKYVFFHQNGLWYEETVDATGNVGLTSSIALDSQDNPHIAYNEGAPNLKYATRPYGIGGIWTIFTVFTGFGLGPSLALDPLDQPGIAHRSSSGALWFTRIRGGGVTSGVLESGISAGSISLAFDLQGRFHISYSTSTELKYVTRDVDGVNSFETVHTGAISLTSLALDSQGEPHISYERSLSNIVNYASKEGGVWTLEVVDLAGFDPSLALDSQDNPHISYTQGNVPDPVLRYSSSAVHIASPVGGERWVAGSDELVEWRGGGTVDIQLSEDGGLTYTTLLSSIGANAVPLIVPDVTTTTARIRILRESPYSTSASPQNFAIGPGPMPTLFVSESVDTLGSLNSVSSMVLDPQDNPRICYRHVDGDLKYAARSVDGSWFIELVGAIGSVGSMKLDEQGIAHLSFWDFTNDYLRYGTRSASGVWTVETVDATASVGSWSSLAIDSEGDIHISYLDATNADLKYATKSGGNWTIEIVDSDGDVGSFSSIALNSQDIPHISYRDETNGNLKLANRRNESWSSFAVDDSEDVGRYTSLVIDDANILHICYQDVANRTLKYASNPTLDWSHEVVDQASFGSLTDPSLILDALGNPHVSYRDSFTGLKYAKRSAGGGWLSGSVQGEVGSGRFPTLVLDTQGQPHISYEEFFEGELRYASAAVRLVSPLGGERWAAGSQQTVEWRGKGSVSIELSTDGGFSYSTLLSSITGNAVALTVPNVTTGEARIRINRSSSASTSDSPGSFAIAPGLVSPWWFTTPDPTPGAGQTTSLALDNLGNPHITHTDFTSLLYVERQGGSWVTAVADPTPTSGTWTSLAFDGTGEPHVSHAEFAGPLRYSNRNAGVWMSEEVDAGPNTAGTSLALGAIGDPYISYIDVFNGHLKVAHKNGGWSIVTADNSGNVGEEHSSLALDALERPHVAYFEENTEENTQSLKMAVSDGAGTYTIETVDSKGAVGTYASLALDAYDVPHVSYYDSGAQDLRYAVKRDGAWHVENVDTEGDVGSYSSLILDETGDPIIAYHDATNGRLKVARLVGGLWWKEFVGGPLSGSWTSVAVDHHGNIRVAYQDYDNTLLQYASAALELSNPSPSDTWPVGASRTVRWDGSGRVNVSLSVDGGNSFQTLAEWVSGGFHGLVVPHQPSAFSQIKVERAVPHSHSTTPGLFKIETDILLLSLSASAPSFELGTGALITWETDPGPEDLAGYKLDKRAGDGAWSTLVSLVTETSYHDRTATPGAEYRLFGVNGLGEELLLGETTFGTLKPLFAGPLPYRGGDLRITFATFGGLGGGDGSAEVALFDVRGRLVRTVASGAYQAGVQTVTWDGRDEAGREVGSGIYFLRSVSAGESNRLKVVVVR